MNGAFIFRINLFRNDYNKLHLYSVINLFRNDYNKLHLYSVINLFRNDYNKLHLLSDCLQRLRSLFIEAIHEVT